MVDETPHVLPGSERNPAPGAQPAGVPATPSDTALQRIEVTLVLRRRSPVPAEVLEHPIGAAEFAEKYGADPEDVRLVTEAIRAAGAEVIDQDLAARRIRIAGPAQTLAATFGSELTWVTAPHPGGDVTYRQRTGPLQVPESMHERVVAVLGLDDRPQARAHFRAVVASAAAVSYTPPQLGDIYAFPANTDGSGRSIAIIELGGGYAQADLDAYFGELDIPAPSVRAAGVDGASNAPDGDPNGADGEVLLDIEVIGALAPKADIVVYFAPNTDAGFVDAVSTAAHATPTPAAISISWGQSEDQWTAQARVALDDALVDAAALGATVTVAAGDDGSSDRSSDGNAHVDFPASSPHALACGGTSLSANATTGVVGSEKVWNNGVGNGATGGGVSDVFALPSWQRDAGVPSAAGAFAGRGVPDVAADADPQTGYRVRVDGTDTVIGGTSAVAPLWAALVARIVQASGTRIGLAQPLLYRGARGTVTAAGFRDIVSGNNGTYTARAGWDACTGLGVPDGGALLTALESGAA